MSTDQRMNFCIIDQELIDAAADNNVLDVRRLVKAGANIEAKSYFGSNDTPLIMASTKGHVQVVKELLEHGADTDARNGHSETALQNAVIKRNLAVVIELLGHCATTIILGKRKSRGADTEAKNSFGNTALHIASVWGYVAIAQALLAAGADCRARNLAGELPIHRAANRRHSAVCKCLLEKLYATTRRLPLHKLLEDLTWIGNPFSSDIPPLSAALHRNALGPDDVVEIVEFLVGPNPELLRARDQHGSLPLHVACRRGASFTIVQSLANLYKASVKSVTSGGDLPLFLACEMRETSLNTIFLLMKFYPDLVYRCEV
jgi:ankyrin repeat protein